MSLPQHKDARLRFQQQVENSEHYVMPFVEENFSLKTGMQIMEVGCGEGGVLQPFLKKGCQCTGVDLAPTRIALAADFLKEAVEDGMLQLISKNIYDLSFLGAFKGHFDLIILKDAIEHIPDQDKLMGYLKKLLKPGGAIFLGFPPWYMPYGGHQQICENKRLSKALYVHLLPARLYKSILRWGREKESVRKELLEIKQTGLSIERFERILKHRHYSISRKRFYLINPIYKYKFGWRPRVQNHFIARLPFVRNFITSCVYYLVQNKDDAAIHNIANELPRSVRSMENEHSNVEARLGLLNSQIR